MKILLCHTHYQQPGGEDLSYAAEAQLLESNGHDVIRFVRHNEAIERMGRWEASSRTLWNQRTYREVRHLLRRERPAVMHCTNLFPLISPSIYYAARAEGVPVVQSLRNYRRFCANAFFVREGRLCQDCLGRSIAWPAVVHGCYRDSRPASAVVAGMLALHGALRTWTRAVDLYFTPTEFARQKHIEGGIPADRIAVKPNFVDPDPGPGDGRPGHVAFVGRLSAEKGIETLLSAWQRVRGAAHLKVAGDGPLGLKVRQAAARDPRIEWLGFRSSRDILTILGDAACLVMPSIYYETFGRAIVEAFSKGTPVVASRLGAMAELIEEGHTGLLAEPGSVADLAAKIETLLGAPEKLQMMRRAARREFETRYTAASNYEQLMGIYRRAIGLAARRVPGRSRLGAAEDRAS